MSAKQLQPPSLLLKELHFIYTGTYYTWLWVWIFALKHIATHHHNCNSLSKCTSHTINKILWVGNEYGNIPNTEYGHIKGHQNTKYGYKTHIKDVKENLNPQSNILRPTIQKNQSSCLSCMLIALDQRVVQSKPPSRAILSSCAEGNIHCPVQMAI